MYASKSWVEKSVENEKLCFGTRENFSIEHTRAGKDKKMEKSVPVEGENEKLLRRQKRNFRWCIGGWPGVREGNF